MWIVRLALRRPYTFMVMAILIAVMGGLSIIATPTDIFPYINIPMVGVIWTFNGMSPDDMAKRVLIVSERAMTTTVSNIARVESTAYNGVGLIRLYMQQGTNVDLAVAQVTAICQTLLRTMPPGIFPPLIVQSDASSVPILQLGLNSNTLTEQQLYDYGQNFIRTRLSTIPGIVVPLPYGGKVRTVMVDLDPDALYGKGLSATDISNALNLQNLILPTGTVKVGTREYLIQLNSSPELIAAMNDMPVKTVNGAPVYFRDIGQVRDGYQVQTNIVRINGGLSSLLTVLRHGGASTLAVVQGVKDLLPAIQTTLPPSLNIAQLFDQSLFVRAAVSGVVREASIAALLTALMILLFLGSWRSTLIVCISIPLSILTSLTVMGLLGETINVMTLGGLALAVGILVDDATVEIENVHRNMGMRGKTLVRAILDGAQEIAIPAFVSTLCICIVFVPVLMLSGTAKFLFTPLAMAVVFAMLTSYLLTRTVVPTLVHYMLPSEMARYQGGEQADTASRSAGLIWRVHQAFDRRFEKFREGYRSLLEWVLAHRMITGGAFMFFALASVGLIALVGQNFFPYVDAGQMRLHVRCPTGTRIEEAAAIFASVENEIRRVIPPEELDSMLDNIGLPNSGINLAFSDSVTNGNGDGEILISLKPNHHPTLDYTRKLRNILPAKFPAETFFYQAADITSQILNFGLPAPVDVQVTGNNLDQDFQVARKLQKEIAGLPGAVDVFVRQNPDYPTVNVNVDRVLADEAGLTQKDVATSLLISLSASGQIAPNQWLDPKNGVNYQVAAQTPQYKIDTFEAMRRTPITAPAGGTKQLLYNLAGLNRANSPDVESHYDIQPVVDIFASPDQRDLGSFAADVDRIIAEIRPALPGGTTVSLRGQVDTMRTSFTRLGLGMIFAAVLVYLVMAVNFQSWLDPFIILMALPGAMAGMLWMLYLTQTTLSVPALMGAIMGIGVATANSILLVTFANDERAQGKSAMESALSAGYTRIRPVTMTALAMIIGMLPMAFALGEGGEQNAPLGRAVIGGLLFATPTTLFFVPIIYTLLRRKAPLDMDRQIAQEAGEIPQDMNIEANRTHRGPWGTLLALVAILGAAAAVYFLGYLPRQRTTKQIEADAALRRITPPLVNAATVRRAARSTELLLPGNVTPLTEAYIFARAAGYLKRRYVDIGDRVRAGQKLADIDAPDLDQQVSQARAALAQAQGQLGQAQATLVQLIATRDLAAITWKRYNVLTASGAVSRQDGDIQSTSAKTAEANVVAQQKTVRATEEFVRASKATLERLLALQSYERITAPFDGVITARNVDVGALISATGSSLGPVRSNPAGPSDIPSGGEIFRLAEIGKLRVLISVPQTNAPGVRVGQSATVTVQQLPNQSFKGKVTRTSSSLDAQSRTLLTEVDVENPRALLLPGMYAMVSFVTDRIDPPFLAPDAALVVRSSGTVLAVLQPLTSEEQVKAKAQGIDAATLARVRRVHFQTVQPGRDYGIELEIPAGLKVGQEVAVSPSDAVQEGALIQIAAADSNQRR